MQAAEHPPIRDFNSEHLACRIRPEHHSSTSETQQRQWIDATLASSCDLEIEIGCGVGWHPISFAQQNPSVRLIAIEHTRSKFNRFISRQRRHQGLENLLPVHANAKYWIPKMIPAGTINRIWLLYPNPEPKNPAARWFNMPFFSQLIESLKLDGEIVLATNIYGYQTEAIENVMNHWQPRYGLHMKEQRVIEPASSHCPRTHFEKKYLERGETCFETTFVKLGRQTNCTQIENDRQTLSPHTIESFCEEIVSQGFSVWRSFASQDFSSQILKNTKHLDEQGRFHAAGIGQGAQKTTNPTIRGDRICWLDESASEIDRAFFATLEPIRKWLNQKYFLGLFSSEAHYAIYPSGRGYDWHFDSFQKDASRTVSFVFYLNQDWEQDDGGELVIRHHSNELKVAPAIGTLVGFLSHDIEHKVCLAHRERYSIACWMKRRGQNV